MPLLLLYCNYSCFWCLGIIILTFWNSVRAGCGLKPCSSKCGPQEQAGIHLVRDADSWGSQTLWIRIPLLTKFSVRGTHVNIEKHSFTKHQIYSSLPAKFYRKGKLTPGIGKDYQSCECTRCNPFVCRSKNQDFQKSTVISQHENGLFQGKT
jgi:hypothetical protein